MGIVQVQKNFFATKKWMGDVSQQADMFPGAIEGDCEQLVVDLTPDTMYLALE